MSKSNSKADHKQKATDLMTLALHGASLVAQMVKKAPALLETWVQPLGWEDPWSGAWQPPPVFLPRESPWTEEQSGVAPVHGVAESDMTERLSTNSPLHTHTLQRMHLKDCYLSIKRFGKLSFSLLNMYSTPVLHI